MPVVHVLPSCFPFARCMQLLFLLGFLLRWTLLVQTDVLGLCPEGPFSSLVLVRMSTRTNKWCTTATWNKNSTFLSPTEAWCWHLLQLHFSQQCHCCVVTQLNSLDFKRRAVLSWPLPGVYAVWECYYIELLWNLARIERCLCQLRPMSADELISDLGL